MPLLRFCVKPGRKWYHRYQQWYAPFFYCFITLVWVFQKDFKHIFEERREQRLKRKPPPRTYISLFLWKVFHYTVFLIIPLFVLDVVFWKIIIGFLAMHFIGGFFMSIIFQLGHIVEGPEFHQYPHEGVIRDSWAEHQVKTSANFGLDFLTTWYCGGLNYQIEHHLFPSICHIHYPAISKIVKETTKEFHLPYHEYKNFFTAMASHFRMLKYFGRTDPIPA